ncbi:MAG: hypothetical protein Hyperionvirus23_7 [Hyperionvirus sp.]|uniref:Uncharacterized protein n=1 Tax=Hyperionvirus sp. TaxID=2487770 RepID=A0A3G5AAR8_9VIRU|nr:MAG: hypothetical protein Hyperionvirus23_7 [Hyperionvirus sp.]
MAQWFELSGISRSLGYGSRVSPVLLKHLECCGYSVSRDRDGYFFVLVRKDKMKELESCIRTWNSNWEKRIKTPDIILVWIEVKCSVTLWDLFDQMNNLEITYREIMDLELYLRRKLPPMGREKAIVFLDGKYTEITVYRADELIPIIRIIHDWSFLWIVKDRGKVGVSMEPFIRKAKKKFYDERRRFGEVRQAVRFENLYRYIDGAGRCKIIESGRGRMFVFQVGEGYMTFEDVHQGCGCLDSDEGLQVEIKESDKKEWNELVWHNLAMKLSRGFRHL